jgi:hypothetical protein
VGARERGTGREGEMKRGKDMGTRTYDDVVGDVGERTRDMGGESKGDIEGKGLGARKKSKCRSYSG